MKRNYNKLIFLLVLISLLISCKKEISFNYKGGDKRIVLNSILNPDSLFSVYLSESIFTNETFFESYGPTGKYKAINNATVKVSDNNGFVDELTLSESGRFLGNFFPEKSKVYTINVSANGFPDAQSTTSFTDKIPIDSVKLLSVNEDENEFYNLNMRLFFSDKPDVKNYYYLVVLYNTTKFDFGNFGGKNIFESNDPVFLNHVDKKQYYIFTDDSFNGKSYGLNFKLTSSIYDGLSNDSISYHFYLCSLNSDFYFYLESYNKYVVTTDPDHNPIPLIEPVDFYNNVSNGFGIFGGYQVDVDTLVYIK